MAQCKNDVNEQTSRREGGIEVADTAWKTEMSNMKYRIVDNDWLADSTVTRKNLRGFDNFEIFFE